MSTENQFWKFIRPRLQPFGRFVRIENTAEIGTLDVYYRIPAWQRTSTSGWIELKHLDGPPKRMMTPINIPTLTMDQVRWLEDEEKAGGRAFLLLRMKPSILLLTPNHARRIYDRNLTAVEAFDGALYKDTGNFLPAELIKCLVR